MKAEAKRQMESEQDRFDRLLKAMAEGEPPKAKKNDEVIPPKSETPSPQGPTSR